jgi:MFS family permease
MSANDMSKERELRNAVLTACVVMFAEGFSATMPFPFASFMVERLRGTKERLGFMTGLYFTAFPIGSLITARMWASQASSMGRRTCLLMSLSQCILVSLATAFCPKYEIIVLLRVVQGLLSCHLPMVRTCLRERVDQLMGDEVRAFSSLQAAFAASAVAGPAVGGLIYGFPADQDFIQPQALPFLLSAGLYVLSFILSYIFMVETADLKGPSSLRYQESKKAVLFGERSIIYFLAMVTGHSFVFTGWEVGYPLLARNLEAWNSPMIGNTFLVGGLGLLLHTLFTYPIMVKKIGLSAIWTSSWMICIVIVLMFPRTLNLLLALGFDSKSCTTTLVNYVSQLFISVLQGCNFTTLQLMLNGLIGARSNSEYLLPLANAWIVSLQGLARAISPSMTGSLVFQQSVWQGNLAFDALAGIAAVGCLIFGILLQKTLNNSTRVTDTSPQLGDVEDADGYEKLMDEDGAMPEARSSTLQGYILTIALAALSSSVTLVTGIASKSVALPPYTENFVRCFSASITMLVLCVFSGERMIRDLTTMRNSCWLAVADWFFLWGYVKTMAHFDTTQFAAENVSMTPILSVLLGFFLLSERSSVTKIAAMLRNIVVVILVIDPFGFFKEYGSAGGHASSDKGFMSGFAWCLLACLGTVFMRIVQRSLTHVPSTVTSFWCFAINTVLWFPPGSIPPEIRLSFLWPQTAEDRIGLQQVPPFVWVCTLFSGMMGALIVAGQAVTLRYIDVGTYSNLCAPLSLVCSFLVDALSQSSPQSPRVVFGVSLAVIGIAAEGFVGALAKGRLPKTSG